MIYRNTPNGFTVDLVAPSSPGWAEAVRGCHPAVKDIAVAGLGAVIAATEGRLPNTPMLGDGIDNVVNQDFLAAAELHGDREDLAVRGLQVIAATKAASRLLAGGARQDLRGQTGVPFIRYSAFRFVDGADTQRSVGAALGHESAANVQVRSFQDRGQGPIAASLSFAARVGLQQSVGAHLSVVTSKEGADLDATLGSRDGDFVGVDLGSGFNGAARFARAINIALRARGE